jgi:hypothetical protein
MTHAPNESEPLLDVQALLEQSQPRSRPMWLWYLLGLIVLVSLFAGSAGQFSPEQREMLSIGSTLAIMGLLVGMGMIGWAAARASRQEQRMLQSAEEFIRLRRWSEATTLLGTLLSRPTRTHEGRVQGFIYLTTVLARYHHFGDALTLYEYLLNNVPLDFRSAHGLRLGRAMCMLNDDRLFDADRAISELRRDTDSGLSGGLSLVELYRDIKTGHPQEAIDLLPQRLPSMRQQLGHRLGDAYALAASAYDSVGRSDDARDAFHKATLLVPIQEVVRRYPELAPLPGKYAPAKAPAEAA